MILIHILSSTRMENTRFHAASDGSLYELNFFARALDLDQSHFVNHRIFPHYTLLPDLYQRAVALDFPTVRQTSRKLLPRYALTRQQVENHPRGQREE